MIPKAIVRSLKGASTFRVYVTLYGMENPAGARLGRLKPLPDDNYTFDNEKDAQKAAERLQKYLDEHHQPRSRKRRGKRRR